VLLGALSTQNKIGLALVGAAFIVFALVSAFVIPAFKPDYPGRRGLPAFLTICVALFAGMMFAVFFFGREPSEGKAAEGGSSSAEVTTTAATSTEETTTEATSSEATTSTAATTTAAAAPQKLPVTETEFKIALAKTSLKPGKYELDLKNDGQIGHDLAVKGPGVNDEKTPVIDGGKTAVLVVDLKSGTYELYCSVPGHKQAGMDLKITVS
jgi:uncharacterized cupredoxin-like copper-binding protein